jgi:hypothetical protein
MGAGAESAAALCTQLRILSTTLAELQPQAEDAQNSDMEYGMSVTIWSLRMAMLRNRVWSTGLSINRYIVS